ncbi:DUF4115 domain-containing protein [Celeribacter sp.]|uniref:DUF4115 domain-containing protein n=1 Tax=Celeribacter sp. TaxID=1890673 RepID=UPI003A941DDE
MAPEASTKRAAVVTAAPAVRKDPFADPNASFVPRGESIFARIEPGALGSTAVLLLLLAGIGYGGWAMLNEIQQVQMAPVDATPNVAAEVAPLSAPAAVVAGLDETVDLAPQSTEGFDRLYRPQALDVPVLVPRDGPIATLDPRSNGALVAESAEERLNALTGQVAAAITEGLSDAPVQVVEEDAPDLAIVAVNATWVRVQAADGSVLFEKILNAGERYVLPTMEEPPVLRTGNAGGVYFAVNGQAYGPAGSTGSVVKNIALSVDAVSEAFDAVDLAANDRVAEAFRVASAESTTE